MVSRNPRNKQLTRTAVVMLLAVIIVTGLAGCLVKKKDLVEIARTTNNLRIYQPGDYIIYNVSATRVPNLVGTPETLSGTLQITWNLHADLIVPFTGGASTIPVIQEVTTLNLNGGASNQGTIRYISQDANGQVTLHAIEGIGTGTDEHYWLNTQGDNTLSTIESFTIFNSPITFGDQSYDGNPTVDFRILEGCDGVATSCSTEVGRFVNDSNVIGDSNSISTNLGEFVNPFRISFSGNATPSPTFPVVFDIRDVCGTQFTTHSGTMYVMPEIGMVEMTNTCSDSNPNGNTTYYTITLSNTNISLP